MDRKALEAIRLRAVRQVHVGESPEAVIKALGMARACIYNWLALYRCRSQKSSSKRVAIENERDGRDGLLHRILHRTSVSITG